MRKPGDETPEPPGGRAAERLREFIDQRYPGGLPPGQNPLTTVPDESEEDPSKESQKDEDYTAL